jgi:hypothetical protein
VAAPGSDEEAGRAWRHDTAGAAGLKRKGLRGEGPCPRL